MIRCIISIVMIVLAVHAEAADRLLLYHVNKQVYWLHDGKKEAARRGVFLLPKHSILITGKADVMIVQDNGKSLLMDKAGTFTFEQIRSLLQTAKAENVSKNFFAYVFEKFLKGEDGNEKQRVAAVVYRGRTIMQSPADSSFMFHKPRLQWKPEYASSPHRIEMIINGALFDTVVRNTTGIDIPEYLITPQKQSAIKVQWRCYPADSRQPPPFFLFLIPAQKDRDLIQSQLVSLRNNYRGKTEMLVLMEKDLLEQWIKEVQ